VEKIDMTPVEYARSLGYEGDELVRWIMYHLRMDRGEARQYISTEDGKFEGCVVDGRQPG
jgi:hypothetical protein